MFNTRCAISGIFFSGFSRARVSRHGDRLMAEDATRSSRTIPESPDPPAPVMTDQMEHGHDERRGQRRQHVVIPSSDGVVEELLKTRQPLYKRPLVLAAAPALLAAAATSRAAAAARTSGRLYSGCLVFSNSSTTPSDDG